MLDRWLNAVLAEERVEIEKAAVEKTALNEPAPWEVAANVTEKAKHFGAAPKYGPALEGLGNVVTSAPRAAAVVKTVSKAVPPPIPLAAKRVVGVLAKAAQEKMALTLGEAGGGAVAGLGGAALGHFLGSRYGDPKNKKRDAALGAAAGALVGVPLGAGGVRAMFGRAAESIGPQAVEEVSKHQEVADYLLSRYTRGDKSALAELAYTHPEVKKHFNRGLEEHAWDEGGSDAAMQLIHDARALSYKAPGGFGWTPPDGRPFGGDLPNPKSEALHPEAQALKDRGLQHFDNNGKSVDPNEIVFGEDSQNEILRKAKAQEQEALAKAQERRLSEASSLLEAAPLVSRRHASPEEIEAFRAEHQGPGSKWHQELNKLPEDERAAIIQAAHRTGFDPLQPLPEHAIRKPGRVLNMAATKARWQSEGRPPEEISAALKERYLRDPGVPSKGQRKPGYITDVPYFHGSEQKEVPAYAKARHTAAGKKKKLSSADPVAALIMRVFSR
jgi:hypothetical protein